MKIGLYNLEPKIENTALMQVSKYHKNKGDDVELYNLLFHSSYDKIYAFSIFDYSDKGYIKKNMIKGGTGFDINSKLPSEIESCDLDYSIYPKCKTSYLWFSRGCIRKCPFCIVWRKEGNIKSVDPKNLNPKGKYISIMDNNFFANTKWRESIITLLNYNQPINFTSGIDIRIFNKEQGESLQKLIIFKVHTSWDNPKENLIKKIKLLSNYIKPYNITCYVLIGYWSTPKEDLFRVQTLRDLKVNPFVMPYNKNDYYQKHFTRWVNRKEIFNSIKWKDYSNYKQRGGIKKA